MIQASRYCLLPFLCFIFVFECSAQKYKEGSYEFGVISITSISDTPIDSSIVEMINQKLEEDMSMTVFFTKDSLTVKKSFDFFGEIRTVFDLTKMKSYEFKEVGDQASFFVEDISEEKSAKKEFNSDLASALEEGESLPDEIFGLSCTKYEIKEKGKLISMIITTDIAIPLGFNMLPFPIVEEGMLVYSSIEQMGMRITIGIKSFSPIIEDRSVFSIDTIGLVNHTLMRNALSEVFTESDKKDEEYTREYGNYQAANINKELIKNMVKQGALDKDQWNVADALESDKSHDIPSILLMAKDGAIGLPFMNRAELKTIFKENSISSPTLDYLLEIDTASWNRIPKELKYKAICLASIKDHLARDSTRRQIVDNLQRLGHGNFETNTVAQSYINGETSLPELFEELNIFTKIKGGIALNNNEIYRYVENFYNKAFSLQGVEVVINRQHNLVIIRDGENEHYININYLKEIDYEKSNYNNDSTVIVYRDTVKIDHSFYKKLLNPVKQIGVDHNTAMSYGIYHLEPPFVYEIGAYDYNEIIAACPALAINIEGLYLEQYPNDAYHYSNDIGTSFPHYSYTPDQEVKIRNFEIGDAGYIYSTTSEKKQFIAYLYEHYQAFGLTKENVAKIADEIKNNLVQNPDGLLAHLPNTKIIIRTEYFSISKGEYRPLFTEEKNQFKDAYPALYRIIGEDFEATNFFYDNEEHKILFDYGKKQHTIDPGNKSMMAFILKNMRNTKSGKQLYPVSMFSTMEQHYYYLTPIQKKELSTLMTIPF